MSIILVSLLTLDLNHAIADEKYKLLSLRLILTSLFLNNLEWEWYIYCLIDLIIWKSQGTRIVYFVQIMVHLIQIMSYSHLKIIFALCLFIEFLFMYKYQVIVFIIYLIVPSYIAPLFQLVIVHCLLINISVLHFVEYLAHFGFFMYWFWAKINT